jgi:putative MFS transporter
MLARFGAEMRPVVRREGEGASDAYDDHSLLPPVDRRRAGVTAALTLAALSWGLVNFGVLLWLPGALVDEGRSVAVASALIARSTLIAAPVILISVWLYSAWSTRGALALMLGVTAAGLTGFLLRGVGVAFLADPTIALSLLIVGSSGVIAIILPYTAESYPLRIRGRATGWVAGCSKLGGLLAQGLTAAGAVPPLGLAAGLIAVPAVLALVLISMLGKETRGRDLSEMD